jgi:hypothetical protein
MRDTIFVAKKVAELVDLAWRSGTYEADGQQEARERMDLLRAQIHCRVGRDVLKALDETTVFNGT